MIVICLKINSEFYAVKRLIFSFASSVSTDSVNSIIKDFLM